MARSGELDLYYDDLGDPGDPAVLLIMGLGAQMISWRSEFVSQIADAGYRVIRFDNRDIGLSSKLDRATARPAPFAKQVLGTLLGRPVGDAPYRLPAMADDAVAVLDHLGIERAHIVGASMGGMITQIVAADHADRTESATVIMSSNRRRLLPPPGAKQILALTTPAPTDADRDTIIKHTAARRRVIGSPVYPQSDEVALAHATESFDRSYYPAGMARQMAAILGTGSLVDYNRRTTAPTLVMHGTHDKLMPPSGARAIIDAIPHARLSMIDGMAHDLPEPLWPQIVNELTTHFRR